MHRDEIANQIIEKLNSSESSLRALWASSGHKYFYIDHLLPEPLVEMIRNSFPSKDLMRVRHSLREHKYVAAQMDRFNPILEEVVYAFQAQGVREVISKITCINHLLPDERLYAGGISMMSKGHFLNPHLDNSHNNDRSLYRALNLLFYVSPDWQINHGGHLELWDDLKNSTTIQSQCNRLVVMATNKSSWHSVSKVRVNSDRCCISNYFFTKETPESDHYFHITSFRGRPGQRIRSAILLCDSIVRTGIRKIFPRGLLKTKHIYVK